MEAGKQRNCHAGQGSVETIPKMHPLKLQRFLKVGENFRSFKSLKFSFSISLAQLLKNQSGSHSGDVLFEFFPVFPCGSVPNLSKDDSSRSNQSLSDTLPTTTHPHIAPGVVGDGRAV